MVYVGRNLSNKQQQQQQQQQQPTRVKRKMTQNADRPQPITLFGLWPYTWSPYDHTFFLIHPKTQKLH